MIDAAGSPMINWTLALPEIVLSVCGLVILLFGVMQKKGTSALGCTVLTLVAFLVTAVLVILAPAGTGYRATFVNDGFARFMKILSLAGAAFALLMSLDYNVRQKVDRFEFPVLVLFSTVGTLVMASSGNLMTLYVGLELQSLAIYILCAFARDELTSAEAGLKYFVLGSLASGPAALRRVPGLRLCRHHGIWRPAHRADRWRRRARWPRDRHRVRVRGPCLQAVGRALPHVDSRRLPGSPHLRDRVSSPARPRSPRSRCCSG